MAKFEEVMERAQALDMAENEKAEEIAPRGDFSKDSMNRFIEAVNKVIANFGQVPALEMVEEDVDALPIPVLKYVSMINKALDDAKFTEYSIESDGMATDRDLMMARGRLDAAAGDRAFKAFLRKPPVDQGSSMEVEVSVEEPAAPAAMEKAEMSEDDLEKIMMSRM